MQREGREATRATGSKSVEVLSELGGLPILGFCFQLRPEFELVSFTPEDSRAQGALLAFVADSF